MTNKISKLSKMREYQSLGKDLDYGRVASALIKAGGVKYTAAKILNCSSKRLTSFIGDNPSLNEVIDEATQDIVGMAREKLMEKVREGDMSAVRFTLQTLGKDQFSTRQEITGADGNDLFEFKAEDHRQMVSELVKAPTKKEDSKSNDNEEDSE